MATAALLLPALWNGYPFLFFDTVSYHELGGSIVKHVTALFSHGDPAPAGAASAAGGAPAATAAPADDQNSSLTYIGGRSPYYGLLVYLAETAGPIWIVAILQALSAAWVLGLAARCASPSRPRLTYAVLVGVLVAASTLPFYAAFIMPDVLTGVALVGLGLLTLAYPRLSALERWALVALTGFAIVVHTTNLLLAVTAIAALGLGWLVWGRAAERPLRRVGLAVAAVALSLAASGAFLIATRVALHESPHNPPYLMARVLADGPGQAYLEHACLRPDAYEICRYKDRPFTRTDDFLWSPDPAKGVFQLADDAGRRRLIAEQTRFVLSSVAYDPRAQMSASFSNAVRQLGAFQTAAEVGLARTVWDQMTFAKVMPSEKAAATGSRAYRGLMPFGAFDWIIRAGLLASVAALVWRLTRRDVRQARASRGPAGLEARAHVIAAVALALVIVANAVLCGALSGVYDRYEARLIWLVPALAVLTLSRFGIRATPTGPGARPLAEAG